MTQEMNDNILSNLCTAVISLDPGLRVCSINQAAESLLEISANRALTASIADLASGLEEFVPVLLDAMQSGHPYTQRMAELNLPSGNTVTADLTVSPISDGDVPRLIIEVHPLDRYLRIDRDAAVLAHQEISRQVIRGLAHEVKNPLGGIKGSAQLLAKELGSPDLKEYTTIIIEETDRLTGLVDRMLGPRALPCPRPTNIHELLERVRKLLELEDKSLQIIRDYDPSIPELIVDSELIFQAILNIARNALQSMADVEHPTLTLTSRTERQYTIDSPRHRNVLRLDIADNGCGIPDNLKQHLFYPMISGRLGGTGLGLPLAQTVVHQHRGIIEFDSRPGATVFHIVIPLDQQLEQQP